MGVSLLTYRNKKDLSLHFGKSLARYSFEADNAREQNALAPFRVKGELEKLVLRPMNYSA